MRVLVDARMLHPPRHGIARYTLNLMKGLTALNVELVPLVGGGESARWVRWQFPKIKRTIRSLIPFANPLDSAELSLLCKKERCDVYHFTSFSTPLLMPPRSVVTIHDLIHLKEPNRWDHRIYYETVVRNALKNSEAIIAVSQWTKADLIAKFSIPTKKIIVVPNSLGDEWFTKASAEEATFKRKYNLNENYIVNVSNTKPHKNLKTLLKAFEELWREGFTYQLVLAIGRSRLPSEWNKFSDKIRVVSGLDEDELKALYRFARLTVSPSQYEGYNLTVAESLAMGTPVVLSDCSAHSEFVGRGLFFYKPYDSHLELAKSIREALTSDTETTLPSNVLTPLEMAKRTLKVYEGL